MPKKPPQRAKPPAKLQPQATASTDGDIESKLESFEQDLCWCIEQLHLGLETQSPDSRQGAEAAKILKILQSSKAPMIKKIQAMRNAFGDYHKKRREEEAKSAAVVKKMKLTSAPSEMSSKSLFYRKSASSSATQTSQSDPKESENDTATTSLSNTFKFQFNISDNDVACNDNSKTSKDLAGGDVSRQEEKSTESDTGREDIVTNQASSSVFKLPKSDNSFRFNFPTPETQS